MKIKIENPKFFKKLESFTRREQKRTFRGVGRFLLRDNTQRLKRLENLDGTPMKPRKKLKRAKKPRKAARKSAKRSMFLGFRKRKLYYTKFVQSPGEIGIEIGFKKKWVERVALEHHHGKTLIKKNKYKTSKVELPARDILGVRQKAVQQAKEMLLKDIQAKWNS